MYLADAREQIEIIEHGQKGDFALVPFNRKLDESDLFPLRPIRSKFSRSTLAKCAIKLASIVM